VREELVGTSSPETVAVLRELAKDLVAQGRQLLRQHPAEPDVPAPGGGPAAPAPTRDNAGVEASLRTR